MHKNKILISGRVNLTHRSKAGGIKGVYCLDNLVVLEGLKHFASLLFGDTLPGIGWVACGSSNKIPTSDNVALGGTGNPITELLRTTVVATLNDNAVKYIGTWTGFTGSETIQEAGLFNFASGGTMLARIVTPEIEPAASDDLDIEWSLIFASEQD